MSLYGPDGLHFRPELARTGVRAATRKASPHVVRIADPAALFQSVSDVSRLRLLRLLCRHELNVQELVKITDLSQPRVSKHLGVLRDQGWLQQRREGTWSWYRAVPADGFGPGRVLFDQIAAAADAVADAAADDRRLSAVLAERRARARDFFAGLADRWDDIRTAYEHPDIRLGAVAALVDRRLRVLDIGTGTGAMLPVFAGAAGEVVALDNSEAMLERARVLCAGEGLDNVTLCSGDLVRLPFADAHFDACHCAMALHHVADPAAAVAEMGRVVRPGGVVTLSAFLPHEQHWMRDELAHHHLGFAREEIEAHLRAAGLQPETYVARGKRASAPADARPGPGRPELDWPDVFLATARKPGPA